VSRSWLGEGAGNGRAVHVRVMELIEESRVADRSVDFFWNEMVQDLRGIFFYWSCSVPPRFKPNT
jgi:hypothetical protein